MVNLIADYLRCGCWMHQAFQLVGSDDAVEAAELVRSTLREQGCEPVSIYQVSGQHRLEELDSLRTGVFELIWWDEARLREAVAYG